MARKRKKKAIGRKGKVGRPRKAKRIRRVDAPKREIIKEVLDHLDEYMKDAPRLKQRVIEELSKNPDFRKKLVTHIVEELT